MQEQYTHKGKHVTIDNRRLIERWKKEGKSNREIAGLLGKAPQTINNEVIRALKFILGEHPILSITADNGSEFNRLAEVFPEEHIHYPQHYYSWERGQRWLPKGAKKMTPKFEAFPFSFSLP